MSYLCIPKPKKGFSIIEVLIAISIISIGLVGLLTLMNSNISANSVNKNKIVAAQLAQEGAELTRKIRDTNWLVPQNWDTNLATGTYIIDYLHVPTDPLAAVTDISDPASILKISVTGSNIGYYQHVAGPNSSFRRIIQISDRTTESLKVTCTVSYQKSLNKYEYTAISYLYNWYQ
jgi:prepilin-type N-terminal cleavage/methylation domain-containing protein